MKFLNDTIYIPCIFPDRHSEVVKISEGGYTIDTFDNFLFSRNGHLINDSSNLNFGSIFEEGKKSLSLSMYNRQNHLLYKNVISHTYSQDHPTNMIGTDSSIYVSYMLQIDTPYKRDIGLSKFNSRLGLTWQIVLNDGIELSYPYLMKESKTNSIILSAKSHYYNRFGSYPHIIQVDKHGSIIWNYESKEKLAHGAVPVWFDQISDSNIVITYKRDNYVSDYTIRNELTSNPYKLVWLNNKGDSIKSKFLFYGNKEILFLKGIYSGKGDYFYTYGNIEDYSTGEADVHALITKYSNQGDTIWSKRIRNPFIDNKNIYYTIIDDIFEQDDGSIVIVSSLYYSNDYNKIWIFSLDSNGCYYNFDCNEDPFLTSSNIPNFEKYEFIVYPNPTNSTFYIKDRYNIEQIKVMDYWGNVVQVFNSGQSSYDISSLPNGLYIIHVYMSNSPVYINKILKL
jgi:hypothetical protein